MRHGTGPAPSLNYTASGTHPKIGFMEFAFAALENADAMAERLRRDGYQNVTVAQKAS
jgi:hypothetical protein